MRRILRIERESARNEAFVRLPILRYFEMCCRSGQLVPSLPASLDGG